MLMKLPTNTWLHAGHRRPILLFIAIFTVGALLTCSMSYWAYREAKAKGQARFDLIGSAFVKEVQTVLGAPVFGLNGLGALLHAQPELKREQYESYVAARNLANEFPGVQRFGFAQPVHDADLATFVKAQRADGAPNYTFHQMNGVKGSLHYPVRFLAPSQHNDAALGLDLGSEPSRRAVIEEAINTGNVVLSAPISLVQNYVQLPSVLLCLPVYKKGAVLATESARRSALVGVLTAPIVLEQLFKASPFFEKSKVFYSLRISDVTTGEHQWYARDWQSERASAYSFDAPLRLYGRNLHVELQSTTAFEQDQSFLSGLILMLAGLVISYFLAYFTYKKINSNLEERARLNLLRINAERYERLSRDTSNAVIYTDARGCISWVNEGFERLTGYTAAEVIGKIPGHFLQSAQTDAEEVKKIRVALKNLTPYVGDILNQNKNGTEYWVELRIDPIFDESGAHIGFISLELDVTARVLAEESSQHNIEKLRQAKEKAEDANMAKLKFLATMSHELRTPLNGILGMAQLLARPTVSDKHRLEFASLIINSGNTLAALLSDLLDVSQMDANKLQLRSELCDVGALVNEVALLFTQNAADKNLAVLCDTHTPVGQLYLVDAVRLRQMMSNLISNAIKFTIQGHVHVEAVELERSGREAILEFSVQDTGVGIALEKQHLLFQRFSQLENDAAHFSEGSGLGLSIVQGLAKRMGGDAGLSSEVGQGSRFWFRIQVVVVDEGAKHTSVAEVAAAKLVSKATAHAKAVLPKLDIQSTGMALVVDDNPINQKVMSQFLKELDMPAVCVENGQDALDVMHQGMRPVFIVMDVQMPVMDGLEATRRIREWESAQALPRTPIIGLTAGTAVGDKGKCLDHGMDDVLFKPVDLDELEDVIEHLTQRN
jgi:PAS domain S-box-containing protein